MVSFLLILLGVYGLAASPLLYEPDAPLPWFQNVGYRGLSPAFCICVLLGMASLTAAVVALAPLASAGRDRAGGVRLDRSGQSRRFQAPI